MLNAVLERYQTSTCSPNPNINSTYCISYNYPSTISLFPSPPQKSFMLLLLASSMNGINSLPRSQFLE